jgi:FixJ family two-component response regulator
MAFMVANVPIHIVVAVDDDFRVRESLQSLIESAGYEPVVFTSAEEFLQSGTLTAAACVITDVRMPGIDGIELQRRIKRERPDLPVIFISAHNHAEIRQKALDDGAFDFLFKPFNAADLLEAIQAALAKARAR